MGVSSKDHVIVYDTLGIFSAARCWYMFIGFGHDSVSLLNGGLRAWKAAGFDVTNAKTPLPTDQSSSSSSSINDDKFVAKPFDAKLVRSFEQIVENEQTRRELVVDARPAPRFQMQVDEPRAGLRRGTIGNSVNVPALSISDANGLIKSDDELLALFAQAGVGTASDNLVVSCGSGLLSVCRSMLPLSVCVLVSRFVGVRTTQD